jgi:hypothetical protein
MKKEKKNKLFEKLKLNFPGIKKISLSFYADCDSFESFSNVEFDDKELETEVAEKEFISIVEDFIFDNIFNDSKYPIDVYNRGSDGSLIFDIENNKIEYSITYYNNPNNDEYDFDDEDNFDDDTYKDNDDDYYEKNYSTTF